MKGRPPVLPSLGDPLSLAEFDDYGFAQALCDGRRVLGLSTRDLAQLAGVSQAYIVALERAARPLAENGPTPTVEVVARLAWALRREPTALFAASLRYPARHVLHIIEFPGKQSSLDLARDAATTPVDAWIWSTAKASGAPDGAPVHDSIRLHLQRDRAYKPERIVDVMKRELAALNGVRPGELGRQRLGLVFDEMSEVMRTVTDPDAVIAFEANWAQTVEAAVNTIGARVAWNVCVYELAALRRLSDPAGAAQSLLRSHDTVWFSHARGRATGDAAARRLLRRLA